MVRLLDPSNVMPLTHRYVTTAFRGVRETPIRQEPNSLHDNKYQLLLQRMSYLTRGPPARPFECHALDAPIRHHGMQGRSRALKPPIGQEPRTATVDLLALWLLPTPLLVLPTGPGGIAHNHVAILALIADDRLVGDCGEHGLAIGGGVWDLALDRNASGQLGWGPRSVALAVTRVLAHQLKARHTLVGYLQKKENKKTAVIFHFNSVFIVLAMYVQHFYCN